VFLWFGGFCLWLFFVFFFLFFLYFFFFFFFLGGWEGGGGVHSDPQYLMNSLRTTTLGLIRAAG